MIRSFPTCVFAGGPVFAAQKWLAFFGPLHYNLPAVIRTNYAGISSQCFGIFTIRKATARQKLSVPTVANNHIFPALITFFVSFLNIHFHFFSFFQNLIDRKSTRLNSSHSSIS